MADISTNPLLRFFEAQEKQPDTTVFPPYRELGAEFVVPGMEEVLRRATAALEALEKELSEKVAKNGEVALTYAEVAPPLEALSDRVDRVWSSVRHLKSVAETDDLRKAVEEVQPKVVDFGLKTGQSKALYEAWKTVLDNDRTGRLSPALSPSQKRISEGEFKDAQLSGVALEGEKKERFNELAKRLTELSTKFSNNVLDCTKAYSRVITDKKEVDGLPATALAAMAQNCRDRKVKGGKDATAESGPWLVTLDFPTYLPIAQFAKSRKLREEVYRAFLTRASEFFEPVTAELEAEEEAKKAEAEKKRLSMAAEAGEKEADAAKQPLKIRADNAPLIKEILRLRQEKAELLGYRSYVDVSMAKKMATEESALKLLEDLRKISYDGGVKELKELEDFAKSDELAEDVRFPQNEVFRQWDSKFYEEKLKEARYKFNEEELKPYFSLPKVQAGLWALVDRIFSVSVERLDDSDGGRKQMEELGVSLWHDDVQFFRIVDKETKALISYFYFDPYARAGTKKDGAWMGEATGKTGNKLMTKASEGRPPVAYMVCNGPPPVDGKPSLLGFRDVETLFHEFGHALQHMLTKETEGMAAGIRLVDWDAVEQPSQFMENWVYDRPTVDKMAFHFETGEAIPDDLWQKVLKAKTFRAASLMLRQLRFGLVDLKLHALGGGDGKAELTADDFTPFAVDSRVAADTDPFAAVGRKVEFDRFLCGFQHIFAGGYSAGYFSYMWAEILSADCFGAFEDAGLDNEEKVKETGKRFKETVLGLGGGIEPAEVFRRFRGRDPTSDALLRHNGLLAAGAA